MTDDQQEQNAPDPAADTQQASGDRPGDQEEQQRTPSAEAKQYRLRLRDAENERDTVIGERDGLRTQLDETVKGAVSEMIRATSGVNPESLWKLGVDPADFLNEGKFDTAHAKARALDLAKEHGLTVRRERKQLPGQGARDATGGGASWGDVIRGRQ